VFQILGCIGGCVNGNGFVLLTLPLKERDNFQSSLGPKLTAQRHQLPARIVHQRLILDHYRENLNLDNNLIIMLQLPCPGWVAPPNPAGVFPYLWTSGS
jgi:hypothetical protein